MPIHVAGLRAPGSFIMSRSGTFRLLPPGWHASFGDSFEVDIRISELSGYLGAKRGYLVPYWVVALLSGSLLDSRY